MFCNGITRSFKEKMCLIQLKTNTDCFMYSVLSSLHPVVKNSNQLSKYEHFIDYYDFIDVRGIVDLKQIETFEKNNLVSVNVYTYDLEHKSFLSK